LWADNSGLGTASSRAAWMTPTMPRKGRPRKDGARYPSGKLKPKPVKSDPLLAHEQRIATMQRVAEIFGRYEKSTDTDRDTTNPEYRRAHSAGYGSWNVRPQIVAARDFDFLQEGMSRLEHGMARRMEHLCVDVGAEEAMRRFDRAERTALDFLARHLGIAGGPPGYDSVLQFFARARRTMQRSYIILRPIDPFDFNAQQWSAIEAPIQIRSATRQHRRHGGVRGGR
jgi:hypothetical protein